MGTYTDGRVTQFRAELVNQFEVNQSYLRETVLKEAMIKGEQAVFLTTGSNGAEATTRGPTGEIPARANYRNPNVAVLKEAHDKVEETGFVDFVSQGDARQMMQKSTMAVINREIDREIIAELATATQIVTGLMNLGTVLKAYATLTGNAVDVNSNDIFGVVTPAAWAQLMRQPQFTSVDYVNLKPFVDGAQRFPRWMGVTWIMHPNLPGVNTNSSSNFLYARNAIGHAINKAGITTALGYNEEDDYTFARATIFHGAKKLQDAGIVKIAHDDTAAFS